MAEVEPARLDQIVEARDGRMLLIDQDVGGVVDDLKRIDAGFRVRFAEQSDCFVVMHENHDGCPHNIAGGAGSAYLVSSVQAHQNRLGVWEGLDQRVVDRVMRIGHSSYDYAAEVQTQNERADRLKDARARERIGEHAEVAAHAIRKDLGAKYKGRIFKP